MSTQKIKKQYGGKYAPISKPLIFSPPERRNIRVIEQLQTQRQGPTQQTTPASRQRHHFRRRHGPINFVRDGGAGASGVLDDIHKLIENGEKIKELKKLMLKNTPFYGSQINDFMKIAIKKHNGIILEKELLLILDAANKSYNKNFVQIILDDSIFEKIIDNYKILKLIIINSGVGVGVTNKIINKILDQPSFTQYQRKKLAYFMNYYWLFYTKDATTKRLKQIIEEKLSQPEPSKISKLVKRIGKIFNGKKEEQIRVFPPKAQQIPQEKYEKAKSLSILRLQEEAQSDPWQFQKKKQRPRKPSPLRKEMKNRI